jgi:MYXO-CTERM domain-containing protein
VRLTHVATGEVLTTEAVCRGDEPEIAAQLGEQTIDPSAALIEACASTAYTCELDEAGDRWDPGACTPWPGGGETSGDPTEGPTGSDGSDGGDGSEGTGDSASGGQDGLVEHGCACDSRAANGSWGWLLLGLGLLRSRRRSRVAKDR